MTRLWIFGIIATMLATSASAQKLPPAPLTIRPRSVIVSRVTAVAAQQTCQNWALAAAIETVLGVGGVRELHQQYWVKKLGSETECSSTLDDVGKIATAIEGEHRLADGNEIRVQVSCVQSGHFSPEDFVVPLSRGTPTIFIWSGHPFVLSGAT